MTNQSTQPPVMWWDGGERAITAREKALIEEHSPSSFAIPLIPAPTPGARWAADRQPDPHGLQYECERSGLTLGHYTDDELANAVFLHGNEQPSMAALAAGKALPGIAYLTAAKDRIRWLSRSLSNVIASSRPVGQTFQAGVSDWMGQCFLPSLYSNMTERGDRLLEEVLELLQAHGYDSTRVATLVNYVYGRPVGEPAQEVGGVMVALAGYCWIAGLDMHDAGSAELRRIAQPEVMEKIRRKQMAKNAMRFDTPLPGNAATPAQGVDLEQFREAVEQFEWMYRTHDNNEWNLHSDQDKHDQALHLLALIDSQRGATREVANG